jgi:hypothetical protein
MLAYCRANRKAAAPVVPSLSQTTLGHRSDAASRNQAIGIASLANISTARRTVSLPSISGHSNSPSIAPTPSPPSLPTVPTPSVPDHNVNDADRAAQEQRELAYDQKTVEKELDRWVMDPLWPKSKPLNLVRYWDVSFISSCSCCKFLILIRYATGVRENLSIAIQSVPGCFTGTSIRCSMRTDIFVKQRDLHCPKKSLVGVITGNPSNLETALPRRAPRLYLPLDCFRGGLLDRACD